MIAYCTNVHAGADERQMRANLQRYTLQVKAAFAPDRPMGIGLWLSARTARQLIEQQRVTEFGDWLHEHQLVPFTFNGFPFGDFHRDVVKHDVYQPQWDHPDRLRYTMDLAVILGELLRTADRAASQAARDFAHEGSISTLPIAWRSSIASQPNAVRRAADHLVELAQHLAHLEAETGRLIHLDLEPEPGCLLDTSADVVAFFETHLLRPGLEALVRRHLRVCHDICHAAVMFEDQAQVLDRYRNAGIAVGKVQVSSAIRADFRTMADDAQRQAARQQLQQFQEHRYLHQTVIHRDNAEPRFYEDLGDTLQHEPSTGEWRIHFHVPLFVDRFCQLASTQEQTLACLRQVRTLTDCHHFEVETYAWNVLPADLQEDDLARGIAREMHWLEAHLPQAEHGP